MFDDNHDLVRLQKQNEMLMEQLKGLTADYEDLFAHYTQALDIQSDLKKKCVRLEEKAKDLESLTNWTNKLREKIQSYQFRIRILEEDKEQLERQNKELEARVERVEKRLTNERSELAHVYSEKEEAEERNERLEKRIKGLEEQNKALEQRNNALKCTVDQLDSYRLKHELLLERVNSEIGQCQSLSEEIRSKNVELAELKDELDLETHHVSCLEDEIRELKRVIEDYARLYGPHRGYDPDAF